MADSYTENYDLVLPEVGGSSDTWGEKLNSNFGTIDEVVKATGDTNAQAAANAQTAADNAQTAADNAQTAANTLDGLAVKKDANTTTGAALLPGGTQVQRPASPANGMFRYNSEKHQFEGYQNGKWGQVGGGRHVLSIEWEASRDMISDGYAAADGQELSRATYPEAWDFIETLANVSSSIVVDDATWTGDPSQRGKFSTGDGSSTFRLPDLNGKSSGTYGAVYLTGDGLKTAGEAGLIRQDEMQQITGSYEPGPRNSYGTADVGGAFKDILGSATRPSDASSGTHSFGFEFDSANSPDARTNTYTHGTDVSGVWVIRLFGAVVNVGSADAGQLASDYANLASQVQQLESGKLDADKALGGEGQSWEDLTSSRSLFVEYTNTAGYPIYVSVYLIRTGSTVGKAGVVNGVPVTGGLQTSHAVLTFIVPVGATYGVGLNDYSWEAGTSISEWWELR